MHKIILINTVSKKQSKQQDQISHNSWTSKQNNKIFLIFGYKAKVGRERLSNYKWVFITRVMAHV